MRTSLGTVLIATVSTTVAITAAACDQDVEAPAATIDAEAMYDVAGDPDASVDDIVAAGRPAEIARSGAGQLLVSYLVESDDDEGPQASAWRLYDPDGGRVAQGHGIRVSEASAQPDFWGLADGFLVREDYTTRNYEVMDSTGDLTAARRSKASRPTRAGDVQLDDVTDLVFRPSTNQVFAEPPSPAGRRQQSRAIDDRGGAWVLGLWRRDVPVLHSRDGGAAWETTRIRLPPGGYPLSVHPAGDRVVVPLARPVRGEERLVSLAVRDLGAPATVPWRVVPARVGRGSWFAAAVGEVEQDRLLVSNLDSAAYLVDTAAGTWRAVTLPDERDGGWSVESSGQLLIATDSRSPTAYSSDDRGRSWEPLPR